MKPNYSSRKIIGWAAIILISLVPVALWMIFGEGTEGFVDYSSATHSLGELFGLVGMTMFALTFVLSTRIKYIEDVFGGLDKVYLAHGVLGGTALILILMHPIFLVLKFVPSDMATAAGYLLPGSYWSVNFGIIALVGMITLIVITLYSKMKYHRWKFTHEFFGAVFLLAVLHIFLVRGVASADNIFDGYYYYASAVSFVGIAAFAYSLFLKNRLTKNAIYKVKKIESQKGLFVVEIVPEHKPLKYSSGQFVFVRFYNSRLSNEAHPFSIASKTDAAVMRLVIKKLGDFTNLLDNLEVGDKVSLEGPYGRFHFRNYEDREQVWLASGIGITPFIGMAEDLENEDSAHVDLYHTVSDNIDLVGAPLFKSISLKNGNFRYFSWNSKKNGRITGEVMEKISGSLSGKGVLICGSSKFKESIMAQLKQAGVPVGRIHEEAFDFR